jgi:hypothetical protein
MYSPMPGSMVGGLLNVHRKTPLAYRDPLPQVRTIHKSASLLSEDPNINWDYYNDILNAFYESSDAVKNIILGRPLIEWTQVRYGNYLFEMRDS